MRYFDQKVAAKCTPFSLLQLFTQTNSHAKRIFLFTLLSIPLFLYPSFSLALRFCLCFFGSGRYFVSLCSFSQFFGWFLPSLFHCNSTELQSIILMEMGHLTPYYFRTSVISNLWIRFLLSYHFQRNIFNALMRFALWFNLLL